MLTDVLSGGPALPGADDIGTVAYRPNPGGVADGPRLWHFALRRQLAPTRAVQRDYTFNNPPYNLEHRSDSSGWISHDAEKTRQRMATRNYV